MLRRTFSRLAALMFWLGLALPAAAGADPVEDRIAALEQQGYAHFQITRRLLSVEIEAYAPAGQHLHMELARDRGDILESRTDRISRAQYDNAVQALRRASAAQNPDAPAGPLGFLGRLLAPPAPRQATAGISYRGPAGSAAKTSDGNRDTADPRGDPDRDDDGRDHDSDHDNDSDRGGGDGDGHDSDD